MRLNFTLSSYSSKCLLFVSLLLSGFVFSDAQTAITEWNFNNSSTVPSVGTGTLTLTGGITATYAAGVNADPGNPNRALNTSDYPVQGTAPKTAGITITVNTTGYNYVHLKYYLQHSTTAAKKVAVQYYDGAIWQDITSYIVTNAGSFLPQMDVDLSAYPALNNNAGVQLRLVTDFSNGNAYEPVSSANYNAGTGTIRYDWVTVTGSTLACVGPATQQAGGLRLLKTDATSAQLTLSRGNGGGCLVVCSQSGIPSTPVNNTVYTASPSFGTGATIGNGYAVYNTQVSNPAIQYFNITNLVAGTKYYLAAYEYSSSGNCYLAPAYVDSFYCNSTVLYPGDMQFIGYDNNVGGGRDAFVLTNLKTLKTGTSFQIVNSRYEAGAAADTRTNRWYAGAADIHQNLQQITVTYTGALLDSGSVISFDHVAQSPGNVKINGMVTTTDLSISDNLTISNLLSGTGAEQFFLTQGKFSTYGSIAANNQYSILNGHVLHGISYDSSWVDFSQPCDSGSIRQSRIPPDINGIKLYMSAGGFAYYNPASPHIDSLNALLSGINYNPANWTIGSGTASDQINPAVLNTRFNPNRMAAAGTWTGAANDNNWFNSLNWDGFFVPDSTVDVIIPAAKISLINANAAFANLYNRVALTRALTIAGGAPFGGNLSMNGNGPVSDKLIVYDSLLVDTTGRFNAIGGSDTIVLRGNLQRRDGADIGAFQNSFINLEENRQLKPIDIWLITGTLYNIRTLAINNPPGVRLINGGIETAQELRLGNGVLSVTPGAAIYYLSLNCNIISPVNLFGETNRGWEKSFIDGRVTIRTDAAIPYTAPVGNAAKNIFAPLVFEPDNNNIRTYSVSYIPTSHPNVSPADVSTPPLDHVSELEYWTLNSINADAAAKITLYYTPYSRVSGTGNTAQALADLRIAQYWDSISNPIKWRLYGLGGTYTVSGDSSYGKIRYDQYATDLRFSSQNFTLGTISPLNALPVQLISWKAVLQNKRVQLNWQVADESDVAFYNIEKSADGRRYTGLQTIQKTNTGTAYPYTCYDDQPADGWNYYRLKAVGSDGKIFYSGIQRVWFASKVQWTVYPNPATNMLWLQLPAAGTVTLYTIDGKMMLQSKLPASLNKLNIQSLAKGMYVLEYFDGRKRLSEKIRLQ